MKGPLTDLSVRGPVLGKPALFTELLVINRHKGLATAHTLDLNVVGVISDVAQGAQLSQKLSASLDKPPLAAQLIHALIAVTDLFVEPPNGLVELTVNTSQRAC
jgi:hypothetical protein